MMMSACSSSSCATPHSLALLLLLVQQLSIEMGSLEVSELGRHVTSSFSGVKVVEELWGSGSAALRCASRLPARFVRRSVMQLVLDMQPHPHVPQYKEASVLFKVGGAGGSLLWCWCTWSLATDHVLWRSTRPPSWMPLSTLSLVSPCHSSQSCANTRLQPRMRCVSARGRRWHWSWLVMKLKATAVWKESSAASPVVARKLRCERVAVCVLLQCGRAWLIPEQSPQQNRSMQ